MVSILTDAASDAELAMIEMAFRGVFDAAKLTAGWKFRVECARRNGRPIVAVALENTNLPEGDPKRVLYLRVSITRPVRDRGELKPVVMEVLRRHLEKAVPDGLDQCWWAGENVARPAG